MYLKRIVFEKYGPLKNTKIVSRFKESGEPIPIALVGVNGAGKTLVLSSILDALVTMRSQVYSTDIDVHEGKLFKPLKQSIRSNNTALFAMTVSDYTTKSGVVTFSEVIPNLKDGTEFDLPEGFKKPEGFDVARFKKIGLSKASSRIDCTVEDEIKKTVLAFFPAGRAELPGWLGSNTKINFDISQKFSDQAGHSIWRMNLVNEISQWLLDIVLDTELYDREQTQVTKDRQKIQVFIPVVGRNRRILNHLNQLVSDIVQNHFEGFVSARFAIAERSHGSRYVMVLAKRQDGTEVTIANQLEDLSTGELMAFCLFADIIRMAELQGGWDRENINDIKGLVLVDEVDIHLHIRLQKEVLPSLIKKFPKVQFIFSTHSPFLALGVSSGEVDIISMPTGSPIDVADFSEFGAAYDTFFEQDENFKRKFAALEKELINKSKITVFTEGKTDFKHLRHTLDKFQENGCFPKLDVIFYETPEQMGDGELKKLFNLYKKFPPPFPIVCLFDRDKKDIVKEFAGTENGYIVDKKVAGMCLVVPDHRSQTPDISIEHLYTDKALYTFLPGTTKRLRFNHEIAYKHDKKAAFLTNTPDEQKIEIYDSDTAQLANQDGTQKGELAISKSVFADEIALSQIGSDFDLEGFRPTFELLEVVVTALGGGRRILSKIVPLVQLALRGFKRLETQLGKILDDPWLCDA